MCVCVCVGGGGGIMEMYLASNVARGWSPTGGGGGGGGLLSIFLHT